MASLDAVLGGFYWGDNVVWEVEEPGLEEPFYRSVAAAGSHDAAFYVTFEREPAEIEAAYRGLHVIDARPGRKTAEAAPLLTEVTRSTQRARHDLLLFDSLDAMVARWGAETAARFFSRCCPLLLELGAVAYWAFTPAANPAPLRRAIGEITQCVLALSSDRLRIVKAEGRPLGVEGSVFRYHGEGGTPVLEEAPAAARLGAALHAVRLQRGLSQAELARLAGVSPSAISQAERGRRGLSLETLIDLTTRLGITLDELLRGAVKPGYRLGRGVDARDAGGQPLPLLDDPAVGLRAYVVHLPPGAAGEPGSTHKGVELIAVAAGLVQVLLDTGRPVLREGETLLVDRAEVRGWRNLSDRAATLFRVLRD